MIPGRLSADEPVTISEPASGGAIDPGALRVGAIPLARELEADHSAKRLSWLNQALTAET
jgi:hypothetical protein